MKTIILLRRLIQERITGSEKRIEYFKRETDDLREGLHRRPNGPEKQRYYAAMIAAYRNKIREEELAVIEWRLALEETNEVFKEGDQ